MKMLVALISSCRLDEVSKSLSALGISGMTLSEVKCPVTHGSGNSRKGARGREPGYRPKIKIEVALEDEKADELLGILSAEGLDADVTVDTICIFDIINSVRIRTGEQGDKSL